MTLINVIYIYYMWHSEYILHHGYKTNTLCVHSEINEKSSMFRMAEKGAPFC